MHESAWKLHISCYFQQEEHLKLAFHSAIIMFEYIVFLRNCLFIFCAVLASDLVKIQGPSDNAIIVGNNVELFCLVYTTDENGVQQKVTQPYNVTWYFKPEGVNVSRVGAASAWVVKILHRELLY